MKIANEQVDKIYLIHEKQINNYFLWKFVLDIAMALLCLLLVCLPMFKFCGGIKEICERYGYKITNSEEKYITRLFNEQEKTYKKQSNEMEDVFGNIEKLTDPDIVFDTSNYSFWTSIEGVAGGTLSSSAKKDLVFAYRNSTLLSYLNLVFYDYVRLGFKWLNEVSVLLNLYVGIKILFLLMPLISTIKDIVSYLSNKNNMTITYLNGVISAQCESTNTLIKNQIQVAGLILFLMVTAVDLIFFGFITSVKISVVWTIIFAFLGLVFFMVLNLKVNKMKKSLEYDIVKDAIFCTHCGKHK